MLITGTYDHNGNLNIPTTHWREQLAFSVVRALEKHAALFEKGHPKYSPTSLSENLEEIAQEETPVNIAAAEEYPDFPDHPLTRLLRKYLVDPPRRVYYWDNAIWDAPTAIPVSGTYLPGTKFIAPIVRLRHTVSMRGVLKHSWLSFTNR